MSFRIRPLPRAPFEPLFALSDEALAARGARRVVADAPVGFPCRVSLRDAAPGERLVLVGHRHLDTPGPFAASHAVYVREAAEEADPAPGEVPALLRLRTLAVRAFDAEAMMIAAELVPGEALEPVLERLLADPRAAFAHLHYAAPGCYAARAERA
jgi:hypothetical protein